MITYVQHYTFCFFLGPWGILPLHSSNDWSPSCDHGLDHANNNSSDDETKKDVLLVLHVLLLYQQHGCSYGRTIN